MEETLNLGVIDQSLSKIDYFFRTGARFWAGGAKQPGSGRGEARSAVSTNAHGTYTGLGGKKSKRETERDTVCFVVT